MVGTKAGGKKASKTNRERYGDDFYRKIGTKGGHNGHTGGFASNRALARIAGAKGGRISKRGKSKKLAPNIKRPNVSVEATTVIAKAFWAINKTIERQNMQRKPSLLQRTKLKKYFKELSTAQVARVASGDWQRVMEESFARAEYKNAYRQGLATILRDLSNSEHDHLLSDEGLKNLQFLRDNPRAVYTACDCYEYVTGENIKGEKIHEGTIDKLKK